MKPLQSLHRSSLKQRRDSPLTLYSVVLICRTSTTKNMQVESKTGFYWSIYRGKEPFCLQKEKKNNIYIYKIRFLQGLFEM